MKVQRYHRVGSAVNVSGMELRAAEHGGPSGIVHAWLRVELETPRGKTIRGWYTLCYPNGMHPGSYPSSDEEMKGEWVRRVPDCARCLKRAGLDVEVRTVRSVHVRGRRSLLLKRSPA